MRQASARGRLPRIRGDRPSCPIRRVGIQQATPHTRGSTPDCYKCKHRRSGYPAYAGIDPVDVFAFVRMIRLPRIRGDRPTMYATIAVASLATPHTRGSTPRRRRFYVCRRGYPAYAGIDPSKAFSITPGGRLPRIRGDRPLDVIPGRPYQKATPHTRGSTLGLTYSQQPPSGYPAYAGIDHHTLDRSLVRHRLPRIRGDRPSCLLARIERTGATPHTRGSTLRLEEGNMKSMGYPAYAGIDLSCHL